MIDIHCHILPGVDDGPADWNEALAVISTAYNDGVRGMVSTSHVLDRLDDALQNQYQVLFAELKQRVAEAGIEMSLWLAGEIHCQTQFELDAPLVTFDANGRYALVELPMAQIPPDFNDLVFKMELEGITPILAHPERNAVLASRPEKIYDLAVRGVLMQMNAGSLMGRFGKETQKVAETLLTHHLCHFIASDGHSVTRRPPRLSDAYEWVEAQHGSETAKNLFIRHPRAAVSGSPIHALAPIEFQKSKRGLKAFFARR